MQQLLCDPGLTARERLLLGTTWSVFALACLAVVTTMACICMTLISAVLDGHRRLVIRPPSLRTLIGGVNDGTDEIR
jgi:hypothetical protein